MIRKFAYAVAFIFLLVSCNIENGHDEYMGDIIVPESDGSYWIEEIDVENPEDEIPLDNIRSGMMYGAYSADTLSTRSSDSSISRNATTGSFSLLPGEDGRIHLKPSDLRLSAGDKLLAYQLRKHEFTKDKDLYFDYTKEPLFYVYDHRERRYMKIFEEFYRLDFSNPGMYGISNISRVALFDIRLATRGGGWTNAGFETPEQLPMPKHAIHDFSNTGDLNYFLRAKIYPDSNGGWRTCLRTPVAIKGAETALVSPEVYEISASDNAQIVEITDLPEDSNLINYGYIELYGNEDGALIHAPLVSRDDNASCFYVPPVNDAHHFPVYWWNPHRNNELCYENKGQISVREITAADKYNFITLSLSDAIKDGGKYIFTIDEEKIQRLNDKPILIVFEDIHSDRAIDINVHANARGYRYGYRDGAGGGGSSSYRIGEPCHLESQQGITLEWLFIDSVRRGEVSIVLDISE